MLVLSRQRDETIMIGDEIQVTVVDIRGDKVRLGITAPAHIPVHRKEVYDAIQKENRQASQVKPEDIDNLPRSGNGSKRHSDQDSNVSLPAAGVVKPSRSRPKRRSKNGSDTPDSSKEDSCEQ